MVPEEWCKSMGGGVRVGICDTSIDAGHPAFSSVSMIFMEGSGRRDCSVAHGTHIAGTICGISPLSSVFFARVTCGNSGSEKDLLDALLWMGKEEVDVINLSLAYSHYNENIARELKSLSSRGVIITAAVAEGSKKYPHSHPFVVSVNRDVPGAEKASLYGPGEFISPVPGGGYGKMRGSSVSCAYACGIACLAKGFDRSIDMHRFISSLRRQSVL